MATLPTHGSGHLPFQRPQVSDVKPPCAHFVRIRVAVAVHEGLRKAVTPRYSRWPRWGYTGEALTPKGCPGIARGGGFAQPLVASATPRHGDRVTCLALKGRPGIARGGAKRNPSGTTQPLVNANPSLVPHRRIARAPVTRQRLLAHRVQHQEPR